MANVIQPHQMCRYVFASVFQWFWNQFFNHLKYKGQSTSITSFKSPMHTSQLIVFALDFLFMRGIHIGDGMCVLICLSMLLNESIGFIELMGYCVNAFLSLATVTHAVPIDGNANHQRPRISFDFSMKLICTMAKNKHTNSWLINY